MARPSKWLKALFQPILKTDVPVVIKLASGHTADALQVLDSADAELFTIDKDGNIEAAGTITPAAGSEFLDNAFLVKDNVDDTKAMALQCSGITAGQTRVLTVPDYNGTIATLAGAEALTNKTLTSPKVGTAIADTAGNEIIKTPATADAVNEITVTNAAADTSPEIAATGGDTHISLLLAGKGDGRVVAKSRLCDLFAAATLDTASDQTYTVDHLLGGILLRDPNGGARADTLPTAADLLAAVPGAVVGSAFRWILRNSANANETITVSAGAGGTLSGTATVAQNNSKEFLIVFTNVGAATEAYDVYSLGTATF